MEYDKDHYAWTVDQSAALRERKAGNRLDWDNLAEEIESLGNSNIDQIEARLENLILHLLKWKYQPELQCGSWRGSIFEARRRIARVIKKNPSLASYPGEHLPEAYPVAREKALLETGLYHLPEACPWTIEQILADDFLP